MTLQLSNVQYTGKTARQKTLRKKWLKSNHRTQKEAAKNERLYRLLDGFDALLWKYRVWAS